MLLLGAMELTSVQYSVQVKKLENPEIVFNTIIGLVVRLAEHGLIHCDFNEFNIMVCILRQSGILCLHLLGCIVLYNIVSFPVFWLSLGSYIVLSDNAFNIHGSKSQFDYLF